MRLALVALLGCGRVGFDELVASGDAPGDTTARPTLALDPGFPRLANVNSTAGTTLITEAFAVEGDRLLVAVFVWGTGGTDQQPLNVDGGGLTWTRVAYSTFSPGPVPPGTSGDGIWIAHTDQPMTLSVTASRGTTIENAVLTLGVYAFSGADPVVDTIGTHSDQTGLTPLLVSVDAKAADSIVIGGFHHGTANTLRAPTAVTQFDLVNDPASTPNGHFHAIGRLATPTAGPGVIEIGSATAGPFSLTSAIEVRRAP